MRIASSPSLLVESEARRLRDLESYGVLDTPREQGFDDVVHLAARLFDVPIALVSLVDADRQFFKARIGLDICQTAREGSFCTHAIQGNESLVVLDAWNDPRFRDSPLVTGAPFIRFYAGAPLLAPTGSVLGTLCLFGTKPRRSFRTRDRDALAGLARLVMNRMELRRLMIAEAGGRQRFESIAGTSPDAILCVDEASVIQSWNAAAERMFGYTAEEAVGRPLDLVIPPHSRAAHRHGLDRVAGGGAPRLVGRSVCVDAIRRTGEAFPIELSLSKWEEGGRPRFGAILRDITERRREEARLKHAAERDPLTGLANRTLLTDRLDAARGEDRPATVILFDLDGFKDVNDSLGHAVGDEVLRIVAGRLVEGAGEGRLVARLGGDEFVVLTTGATDPLEATALAERLVATIETPIEIGERAIYVGASAGLALAGEGGFEPQRLLEEADLALYRAKSEGGRLVRMFTPELRQVAAMRMSVSSGIRQAWDRREFELYYQPQVRLADGSVTGAEALLRWNHPTRGVVAPGAFLKVLEQSLIALPVSEWVLREACRQASLWRASGLADFRIGVNLFAAQFRAKDLCAIVRRALDDHGLPPHALELEITETILLQHDDRIKAELMELRAMGVGIAFDDYGTGFASLTMLKDYPVTRLKIDRSFVSGVDFSPENQTIVAAIAQLARGFGLTVIAEGIETPEQAALMTRHCAEGQGYLFGRPMPAEAFARGFLPAEPRPALARA